MLSSQVGGRNHNSLKMFTIPDVKPNYVQDNERNVYFCLWDCCRDFDITTIINYTKDDSDHKYGRKMNKTQLDLMTPIPVRRAVRKLGQDIRDARLRRRISTAVMAERASISRTTLNKIEKGDSGVSMGNYANVLFVLGMAERLGDLADVKTDTVGLELIDARLPQRIRKSRQNKSGRKSPQPG